MKKWYGRIGIFLSMFLSVFLVSFRALPLYRLAERQIVIEANGIADAAALADGVQIQSVYLDGMQQDLTDLFLENNWYYENGMFTWNSFRTDQNRIEAMPVFRQAEINFLENPYCGAMTCYLDGKKYASKDLYRQDTGCFRLVLNGEKNISSFARIGICLFVAAVGYFAVGFVWSRAYLQRAAAVFNGYGQRIRRIRFDVIHGAVCLLLLFVVIYNFTAVIEKHVVEEGIAHDRNGTNWQPLTETSCVEQKIDLNAKTTQLMIYLKKEDHFQGCIRLSIEQHQKTIYEKRIYAGSIAEDTTYTLQTPKLQKGSYLITVRGSGKESGQISLLFSGQKIFEPAKIDGEAYDGNIALSLQTSLTPTAHAYRIVLFAVLLLVAGNALWNTFRKDVSAQVYYIDVLLLTAITIGVQFPCFSVTPELIGESGSNFYQMTYQLPWKESLMLDDAGYWPLFQRLIAVFVIFVLKQGKYAVYLMQGFVVLFVSSAFAQFCLQPYQRYVKARERFAVSLFGGISFVAVYGGECLVFHNFAYYGVVMMLFHLMLDWNSLNKKQFVFLTAESVLLCLSKGRYGVFFPLHVMIFAFCLVKWFCCGRKKIAGTDGKKPLVYLAAVGAAAMLQTVYMLKHMSVWGVQTEGFLHILMAAFYYCIQAWITVFIPYSNISWNGRLINAGVLILLLGCGVIVGKNWKKRSRLCELIAVIAVFVMGSAMMNAMMMNTFKNFAWDQISPLQFGRANMFMITGVVFITFLFCGFVSDKKGREWMFSILLLVISVRFLASQSIYNNDNCTMQANWNHDYQVFEKESYIIPVWYSDRFMTKNAQVLYLGSKSVGELTTSQWNYTTGPTIIETMEFPYQTADVFQTPVLKEQSVNSIYAKKAAIGMNGNISVILYDENGTKLCRERAMPTEQRLYLNYVFDQPVSGISRIEFVDDTGRGAQVQTDLFVGICEEEEKEP